jgi:tetratricopeptide (TPR) repeat protein
MRLNNVHRNILLVVFLIPALNLQTQQPASPPAGRATPAQIFHVYALADLGRHAEAVAAFESIYGSDPDQHDYAQERAAVNMALKYTQNCASSQSCMADDFLTIGNAKEALHWQSKQFKSLQQGEKVNVHQGEELDPGSAKSVALADAYDLNARIQAAMGKLGPALRDLDSALDTLPRSAKTAPREAAYHYHRALILAENHKLADAAKACRKSLDIDASVSGPGDHRGPQCLEIDALASPPHSAAAQ